MTSNAGACDSTPGLAATRGATSTPGPIATTRTRASRATAQGNGQQEIPVSDHRRRTRCGDVVRLAGRMFVACFVLVVLMHVVTAVTLATWWATGTVEVSRTTGDTRE